MLGFLGVSTFLFPRFSRSRLRFNPVLGFLGVSTADIAPMRSRPMVFQSRAGFSGRLDAPSSNSSSVSWMMFQSRAGFSGRLDPLGFMKAYKVTSFNPVLGFLGVSTLCG